MYQSIPPVVASPFSLTHPPLPFLIIPTFNTPYQDHHHGDWCARGKNYPFVGRQPRIKTKVSLCGTAEYRYVEGTVGITRCWGDTRHTLPITFFQYTLSVQPFSTPYHINTSSQYRHTLSLLTPPLSIRTQTPEQIKLRIQSALNELEESKKPDTIFDLVLLNDDYQKTVNTLFRTMRDW